MTEPLNESEKAKVLSRVKKMLALAAENSGATEGERDNALRMAHATLAKYGLSLAEADAAGRKTEEKRTGSPLEGRDYPWMRTSASAVAILFFCEYFYVSQRGGKVQHFFVGRESFVATAKEMAKYIITSIDKEAQRASRANLGIMDSNYWRSFCKGAASRVYVRCKEIRESAEKASEQSKTPGTALVLASVYAKEQEMNVAFISGTMGVKTKLKRTTQRNTSAHAHREGSKYGDRLNLSNQVTGPNTNAPKLKG